MKTVFLIFVLVVTTTNLYAEEIFIYPAEYEYRDSINCEKSNIPENRYAMAASIYFGLHKAVDLNNDGLCEYFMNDSGRYGNTGLLVIYDDKERDIGTIGPDFWLGENYNGYAQLVYKWYEGHRTNPIYVVKVLRFTGSKYKEVFSAKYADQKNLALKYYRKAQYQIAAKYFLNLYRMKKEEDLGSANDLALVWIKLEKFEQAKELLQKHINRAHNGNKKGMAAAYFNLGLVYEKTNDFEKAYEAYKASNELWSTNVRKEKLEKIRNLTNK